MTDEQEDLDRTLPVVEERPINMPEGNGNAKALGGALALIGIIGGVWALIAPMQQQIAFLERQQIQQRADSAKEIESRFAAVERRLCEEDEWREWWQREVPAIDAVQSEKIHQLEKAVFGSGSRVTPIRIESCPPAPSKGS